MQKKGHIMSECLKCVRCQKYCHNAEEEGCLACSLCRWGIHIIENYYVKEEINLKYLSKKYK